MCIDFCTVIAESGPHTESFSELCVPDPKGRRVFGTRMIQFACQSLTCIKRLYIDHQPRGEGGSETRGVPGGCWGYQQGCS